MLLGQKEIIRIIFSATMNIFLLDMPFSKNDTQVYQQNLYLDEIDHF